MTNLFIYGSGSTGCELVDTIKRIQKLSPRWNGVYFVDDVRAEKTHYGVQVLRFDEMLRFPAQFECVVALGEPKYRRKLYDKLKAHGIKLATVLDPSAAISESAEIGDGCIVGPGSFVSCHTRLGENVMLEINTVVGHDIVVGKHSVISSCSVIGGHSSVGEETFIGLNATIKDRLQIGSNSIVGMGSSVFHPIGDGLIAMGNPARVVQKNQQQQVFKN